MKTVGAFGGKNKNVLIIGIAVAVIFACCTIVLLLALNVETSVTYLGNVVSANNENLEQFVQESNNSYFADKSIVLGSNESSVKISVSEIVNVDSVKTVESIKNAFNKKSMFKRENVNVLPSFSENKDVLTKYVNDFIIENKIGNGFYSVSDDLKSVNFDFSKNNGIPDVEATVDEVFSRIRKLDFTVCSVKFIENVSEKNADYICSLVNREPVDARINFIDGKQQEIIKEEVGFVIDENELVSHLSNNESSFTVNIAEIKKPDVTSEILANKKMFGDVLATLSSNYNANVAGRSKNISIAASKINGYILQPGDIFSYNTVVGPRTYENGFKDAGVYTANGVESGVGGGICQVSSTLYGAQLMANLKTLNRTNHSYTISYLPTGQDATVSYGSIDYRFQNSLKFPVKIECSASGGVLTVKILGVKTDDYRQIKIYNQVVGKSAPNTVEKTVTGLDAGQKKVVQNGQNGMTVDTYKIYYNNGKEEKREFVHRSVYVPMPKIVEVGATKTQQEPETEVNADEKPQDNSEHKPVSAEVEQEQNTQTEIPNEQPSDSSQTETKNENIQNNIPENAETSQEMPENIE